jgi:hypothetical protein
MVNRTIGLSGSPADADQWQTFAFPLVHGAYVSEAPPRRFQTLSRSTQSQTMTPRQSV